MFDCEDVRLIEMLYWENKWIMCIVQHEKNICPIYPWLAIIIIIGICGMLGNLLEKRVNC